MIEQFVKNNYLIQTVNELGIESLSHSRHDHLFHFLSGIVRSLKSHRGFLLYEARADVGSHDDDRVFEINGIADCVRQNPVFKNLKQNIEDVRVGFSISSNSKTE